MSSLFVLILLLFILKRQALFFTADILRNIPEPAAPVYTSTLRTQPWEVKVKEPAIIAAQEQIVVMSKAQGFVETVHVQTGDKVEQGALLVTLENKEPFYALEKGIAAEQLAESSFQRAEELFEKKMISKESFEEAVAAKRKARAEKNALEVVLDNTIVKAPFSAQIGEVQLSPGQFVAPGTALFEMTTLAPHKVNFTLSERYFNFVDLKKEVQVKIGPKFYPALIEEIDPIADGRTKRFKLSAYLNSEDRSILVGGSAYVYLQWVASEEDVFVVPLEYIDYTALGPTIWTYSSDQDSQDLRASPLLVQLVDQNEEFCSLEGSELEEGMPLITSGFQKLRRGGKIRILEQTP